MSATQGESKELESISGRSSKNGKESRYIETLINDGARTPIDTDSDTYEIHLPPWFDEDKFKRYVATVLLSSDSAGVTENVFRLLLFKRSAVLSDQSNGDRNGRVLRIDIGAFHSIDTGCAFIHQAIVKPNDGLQALRTNCAPHVKLVSGGVATGI